jgi:hypothetical protein
MRTTIIKTMSVKSNTMVNSSLVEGLKTVDMKEEAKVQDEIETVITIDQEKETKGIGETTEIEIDAITETEGTIGEMKEKTIGTETTVITKIDAQTLVNKGGDQGQEPQKAKDKLLRREER